MANPFSSLRMRGVMGGSPYKQIFGGQKRLSPYQQIQFGQDEEDSDEMMSQPDEGSRFYDEMQRIRGQRGPALSAYSQALGEQPTPDQYKPNWLSRIGAGLAAGGGAWEGNNAAMAAGMANRDRPYNQAMEQYNTKIGNLGEQARLEGDETEASLRALSQARALGLNYDKYKLQEREFQLKQSESIQKAENDKMTSQASMMRAKAYADAQRKPGYDTFPQVDGSVLYQNKNDRNDSFVVPANTVAAGQLRVSQTNAQSSRMSAGAAVSNAATSSRNADINATRAKDYTRNVDSLINSRGAGEGSLLAPNIQSQARELAIKELELDPRFAKFVRTDEYDDIPDPKTFRPEEYQFFMKALEAKVKDILSRTR